MPGHNSYGRFFVRLFILFIGALGCGLFSETSSDAQIIFAATEVGMPTLK